MIQFGQFVFIIYILIKIINYHNYWLIQQVQYQTNYFYFLTAIPTTLGSTYDLSQQNET